MSEETNKKLLNLSAKVVEIKNASSTKTNALRKAVEYIDNGTVKYDVVVILDADNLTDNDFLEKIMMHFILVVPLSRLTESPKTETQILQFSMPLVKK